MCLTLAENWKFDGLFQKLIFLEEEVCTASGIRAMFDAVVSSFPDATSKFCASAVIVLFPDFEVAIDM